MPDWQATVRGWPNRLRHRTAARAEAEPIPLKAERAVFQPDIILGVMETGIIGIPYIGKTTLFNALTALGVASDGGGGRPNVGVAQVPDARLVMINQYIETKKIMPATIQLVDVAGLVAGASKGEGLGNKFLSHVRNVDALLHVVRCFDDPDVPHVAGSVDPVRDIEQVETELMLADLEQVETMADKARRQARTGDREAKLRVEVIDACIAALGVGNTIASLLGEGGALHSHESQNIIRNIALLTAKPMLYVANVGEDDHEGNGEHARHMAEYVRGRGGAVVCVCAKLAAELVELDEADRTEMLEGLGLTEPALNVLARATYQLLGLHSFFTAGPKEIRAWTVPSGAHAPDAAGVIHSDLQRGFIRAEVYTVADLEQHHSETAIRAAGKLRTEGKDYVIQDGDVCHILFNV